MGRFDVPSSGPQEQLTPRDFFKKRVIELWNGVEDAFISNEKGNFCRGVEMLLLKLKGHIPKDLLREIEAFNLTYSETLALDEELGTPTQRAVKTLNKRFNFYRDLYVYVIDSIYSSDILEREMDGTMVFSTMDDLDNLSRKVRKCIPLHQTNTGELSETK